MSRSVLILALSSLLIFLGLLAIVFRPPQSTQGISLVRLSPPPELGAKIACDSRSPVTFEYRLRNDGPLLLERLRLDLSCACDQVIAPPSTLAPGETARLAFAVRAPFAGRIQRRVDLLANNHGVVVTFNVELNVDFETPALLSPLDGARLIFVHGESKPRQFSVETLEEREEKEWIEGVVVDPDGVLQLGDTTIITTRQSDPTLVRRTYEVEARVCSLPPGRHRFDLFLRTRPGASSIADHQILDVEVLDRIEVVPGRMQLGTANQTPRRVVVICRAGSVDVLLKEYDQSLLVVQPVGRTDGRVLAFEVTSVKPVNVVTETTVVFQIDEETRSVTIELLPPPPQRSVGATDRLTADYSWTGLGR